jgi:hypothetical protein
LFCSSLSCNYLLVKLYTSSLQSTELLCLIAEVTKYWSVSQSATPIKKSESDLISCCLYEDTITCLLVGVRRQVRWWILRTGDIVNNNTATMHSLLLQSFIISNFIYSLFHNLSFKYILLHVGFPWWHDLCTLMAFP